MKKKILLMVAIMAMLICVFAISVSAMEFDKTEKVTVTLTNGTQECALYDADGDELVWYTLDGGATVISVKAKDLVYSSETDLRNISLADGTALQKDNDNTTNHIVVANLRGRTFTNLVHNGYKSTFDQSKVIQYVYLPSTVKSIACNQYQNCTNLKVLDFPSDAKFSFNDSNFAPGCTSLLEINLTGLTGVTGVAHFSKCTSLSKVIGLENSTTTRIGKHMFNSTAITEIRLPNTLTHLGEAAFNSCKQLKVAYLGASLNTFEINSGFKASDAFNTCTELQVVYLPNTVGKIEGYMFPSCNKLVTIFYTGTQTQAQSLIDNAGTTNNAPFFALSLISYEDFMAKTEEEQKTGKYFVYGYNTCDAFYNGIHHLDPLQSNACAGVCANCNESKLAANPVHDYVTTIVYENYLATGTKTQTCQNANCAHNIKPEVTIVNPLIKDFKGFSVNYDGDGITFGYVIDYDALDEFVKVTGKNVELGFVVAVKAFAGDDAYTSDKAIKANVVKWTTNDEENGETVKYTAADFVLRGNWDKMVDLDGDEVAETDVKEVEFYMAGCMLVGDSVVYINDGASSANAGVITFEDCDQPETTPETPEN